jgi:carboxymethylenebutenolidase
LNIFDQYVHGDIDRRGFLDRAAKYAAAPVTAAILLDMLSPKFAEAQQVAKDDKRIKTEWVEIDSPKGYGKIKAYVAKPANATGKLPTVLVIHENRGLNPHIEDIARRLALDNFLAVAPDALTPLGGYPGDEDKRARCSRSSIRRRPARTSSPPRPTRGRVPIPPGRSARSASATAAAW